ncbi:MAG TPA: DUF2073 domain-containing protein [Candidatus Nanoarchaeia archaeon]|nr:DUF2073 domain-containing protein [Candidatus Nanoarchaeia archaeon]
MDLTLQFVPYAEISGLSSVGRIRKLLKLAKEGNIVLLEGRLRKEEEAELIKTTMEEINEDFQGIELGVVYPDKTATDFLQRMKSGVINLMMGDRTGFTIVGPASIVKEIRRDPNKIQLLTKAPQKLSKKKAHK